MAEILPAAEQVAVNQQTAQNAAQINRPDTFTPTGQVTHTGTPGQPGYRIDESLNPAGQAALDEFQASQVLGAGQGRQRLSAFNERYGPLDLHGLGPTGTPLSQGDLPGMGPGLGHESIQQVANSFYDRGMSRLRPEFESRERGMEQKFANQGIDPRATASLRGYRGLGRDRAFAENDLRLGATAAGRAEHSRLGAEARANRALEAGLQGQQFGQHGANRQMLLDQQLQARNQELQELFAMLQHGNIQNPQFSQQTPQGMQPVTPYENTPWWKSALGDIFGASVGGLVDKYLPSDRRLKKNVKKVGGLYEYNYKGEPKGSPKRIGVMAQEVEKVRPEIVVRDTAGHMAIDVGGLLDAMGARAAA